MSLQTFNSLGDFATFLMRQETVVIPALEKGLERICILIARTAKREFGTYQPEVGPFPKWAPLAETTLYGWGPFPGKIDLGYAPPDNPLLREGELRDSIDYVVHRLEGVIGSPSQIMVYDEFGTEKMPARPVLGPAAFRNKEHIRELAGVAIVSGLIGQDMIHKALGYNFTTTES